MATVVITGANAGVGWDACRQLALLPNTPSTPKVGKIVLTCRSAGKAQEAIERLVAAGCARELFSFVLLDLDSRASVKDAVGALPSKIDKLCLNAALWDGGMHPSGLTKTAMSLMKDAVLVDGLLAAGKLRASATVLYVGTELTRPVAAFTLSMFQAFTLSMFLGLSKLALLLLQHLNRQRTRGLPRGRRVRVPPDSWGDSDLRQRKDSWASVLFEYGAEAPRLPPLSYDCAQGNSHCVFGPEHLNCLTGYTHVAGATTGTNLFDRAKFPVGCFMRNTACLSQLDTC